MTPGLPQWARRVIERRAEFLFGKIAVAEDAIEGQTAEMPDGKVHHLKAEHAALMLILRSYESHRDVATELLTVREQLTSAINKLRKNRVMRKVQNARIQQLIQALVDAGVEVPPFDWSEHLEAADKNLKAKEGK